MVFWDHSQKVFLPADSLGGSDRPRGCFCLAILLPLSHSPCSPAGAGQALAGVLKRISASGLYQFHPFRRDSGDSGVEMAGFCGGGKRRLWLPESVQAALKQTSGTGSPPAFCLPWELWSRETPSPMIPAPGHHVIPAPSPKARLRP